TGQNTWSTAGSKLVGVDYLSVAPFEDVTPTHQILLKAGVIIVEGLDLSKVNQGRYTFYCLPLKIAKSDARLPGNVDWGVSSLVVQ
ncbi:MAG: hypothetical protein HC806_00320, partial [Anaerolineae bacterium]|nr:hypothetical protein [Anaerolineae bacterium]